MKQNESKEMSRRAYDVMSRQGADRDGLACYSRSGESDVGGQGSIMDSAYETTSIKTLSETETDTVDETIQLMKRKLLIGQHKEIQQIWNQENIAKRKSYGEKDI